MSSNKFCPNCGNEVRLNERFCPVCGTRLKASIGESPKSDSLNSRLEQIEHEQQTKKEITSRNSLYQDDAPEERSYTYQEDPPTPMYPQQPQRSYPVNPYYPPTPNVNPQLFASFGLRFIAWLIDGIIVYFITNFLAGLIFPIPDYSLISNLPDDPNQYTPQQEALMNSFISQSVSFLWNVTLLNMGIFTLYSFAFQASGVHATLGQLIVKIKVVDQQTLQGSNAGKYLILGLLRSSLLLLFFDFVFGKVSSALPGQGRLSNVKTHTVVVRKNVTQASFNIPNPGPI